MHAMSPLLSTQLTCAPRAACHLRSKSTWEDLQELEALSSGVLFLGENRSGQEANEGGHSPATNGGRPSRAANGDNRSSQDANEGGPSPAANEAGGDVEQENARGEEGEGMSRASYLLLYGFTAIKVHGQQRNSSYKGVVVVLMLRVRVQS